MVIDWPSDLVSDIARRRCVVFLGSGISKQSQNVAGISPKTWSEFLMAGTNLISNAADNRAVKQLIKNRDYLTACEVIKRLIGRVDFNGLMRSEYLAPMFQAAPINDSIMNLDVRIVATPNFDKIYESHVNHVQHASVLVKNYYDDDLAGVVRGTDRAIIKVHGTIDAPDRMIFTRSEYAAARSNYRNFYSVLDALALTNSFLFLGCGVDDPDIRLLLEDYAFTYNFGMPHYIVLPKGQIDRCVHPAIENSLNVKALLYDSRGNHVLLKQAIDELATEVEQKRKDLGISWQW